MFIVFYKKKFWTKEKEIRYIFKLSEEYLEYLSYEQNASELSKLENLFDRKIDGFVISTEESLMELFGVTSAGFMLAECFTKHLEKKAGSFIANIKDKAPPMGYVLNKNKGECEKGDVVYNLFDPLLPWNIEDYESFVDFPHEGRVNVFYRELSSSLVFVWHDYGYKQIADFKTMEKYG